jgi:hypothetical protein
LLRKKRPVSGEHVHVRVEVRQIPEGLKLCGQVAKASDISTGAPQSGGEAAADWIAGVVVKIGISPVALLAATADGVSDEMITSTFSTTNSTANAEDEPGLIRHPAARSCTGPGRAGRPTRARCSQAWPAASFCARSFDHFVGESAPATAAI